MAKSNRLGDIPGMRLTEPALDAFAAVASGGANAKLGVAFGPYPYDIRVRNAWFTPTSADNAATVTGTFRRLSLYNAGTAGTATATANRIASLNLTATAASLAPVPFTVVDATGTSETVASGSMLYFSQETVGGTDANGTVLSGGQFALAYEIV